MRISIVTDAWHPQVNGVVHTWTYTRRELEALGHEVDVVAPQRRLALPVPGEPGLKLSLTPGRHVRDALRAFAPDALHIATEGPLGWGARRWALERELPFTTSYHTRFPEYLARRYRVPASWTYRVMRHFHRPSSAVLVPTPAMVAELNENGLQRLRLWPRGVDQQRFRPVERNAFDAMNLPRPIWINIGRVAPEKGLESMLSLDLPGTIVIVGDGPAFGALRARYPRARWLGVRPHAELAALYSSADVFVFPSRTDTFGLVMLESIACGTPVAAFPVTGPRDVVTPGVNGVLDTDLRAACLAALQLDRDEVRRSVRRWQWRTCAETLLASLVPLSRSAMAQARDRDDRGVLRAGHLGGVREAGQSEHD